jgi:hypothetical protein
MDWQPQIFRINKDALHPTIVLELGMAFGAFHRVWFGFNATLTEGTPMRYYRFVGV